MPDAPRSMPVVDVGGSPHAIGVAHGRLLADEIHAHLARWRAHLAGLGIDDPQHWAADFVAGTGFVDAVRDRLPGLADEVAGIAQGAGLAFADAWLLQLMDESWRAIGESAIARDAPGCTSFGVVNGMRSWCGQTMDLEAFRAGSEAVLRIAPEGGPRQLVVTMAGCIGLLGVSSNGFAVLVNALGQVPAAASGLPVAAIVRGALACDGFDAAVEFVRDAPHATGQHYLLVANDDVAGYECSPAGLVAVMPGATRLWHTNHPLVGYVPEPDDAESAARWEAVRPTMALPSWGATRSRELLEAAPVCRPTTFAAAIVEQSTQACELWVTAGPPQADAWQHVPWRAASAPLNP